MSQKSQHSLVTVYAVVSLALLGFFFVSGISRVHAQETAEMISSKVESVAGATGISIGTLAISDEQGGNTSTPGSGGSGGGSGSLSNNSGENNFATIGAGENSFTTNALGENTFTTATLGENTFTTSATPTTGCVSNCGGGGGGGGTSGGSSGGQVLGAFVAPPAACPLYLLEYIRLGRNNNPVEVRKLQAFLDVFEGERLAITGVYTQADFDAVSRFQAKYLRDVLSPWGINGSTGYVFITTTFAINNIYCNRSTANDIDLRNFYSQVYPAITASTDSNSNAVNPVSVLTASTSSSSVNLSQNPNFFQAAATGLLNFCKFNPGIILITLLALAILFMIFLIWRLSQYPDIAEPALDESYYPNATEPGFAGDADEVLIEDGLSLLDTSDEDPTQPTLDKL